jgi:hypothetical protein
VLFESVGAGRPGYPGCTEGVDESRMQKEKSARREGGVHRTTYSTGLSAV